MTDQLAPSGDTYPPCTECGRPLNFCPHGQPTKAHPLTGVTIRDLALDPAFTPPWPGTAPAQGRSTFREALTDLINHHSMESVSDTPDYMLASALVGFLDLFAGVVRARDEWFGFRPFQRADTPAGERILPEHTTVSRDQVNRAIGEAIGAASMCWDNVAAAGVFDSRRAAQIADELLALVVAFAHTGDPAENTRG